MEYLILRDTTPKPASGSFVGNVREYRADLSNPMGMPMGIPIDQPVVPQIAIEVEETDTRGRDRLAAERDILAITPTMPTALIAPVDVTPAAPAQASWGIEQVEATTTPHTGAGTVVAVLDTGVDGSHPAFHGVTVESKDFTGTGDADTDGHGTHCAGTILGRDVDGARIGVAPGVTHLLAGKVLHDKGGTSEMVFQGLNWALERGAHVISMSLGFDFAGMVARQVDGGMPPDLATSLALEAYRGNLRVFDAIMQLFRAKSALDHSAVVVAAAGNESRRELDPEYAVAASLPAAATDVISVGALERAVDGLQIASFSNRFPTVAAPGVGIVSAQAGGGLATMSGTSMACPHIAGLAALWWEALPKQQVRATPSNVAARLVTNARTDVFAPGVDLSDRGAGLSVAPA